MPTLTLMPTLHPLWCILALTLTLTLMLSLHPLCLTLAPTLAPVEDSYPQGHL